MYIEFMFQKIVYGGFKPLKDQIMYFIFTLLLVIIGDNNKLTNICIKQILN